MWRSEDNFWGLVFSFYHLNAETASQIFISADKSHLTAGLVISWYLPRLSFCDLWATVVHHWYLLLPSTPKFLMATLLSQYWAQWCGRFWVWQVAYGPRHNSETKRLKPQPHIYSAAHLLRRGRKQGGNQFGAEAPISIPGRRCLCFVNHTFWFNACDGNYFSNISQLTCYRDL